MTSTTPERAFALGIASHLVKHGAYYDHCRTCATAVDVEFFDKLDKYVAQLPTPDA